MIAKRVVKQLVPWKWRRSLRERYVAMKIALLHGPGKIRLRSNESVVTCVVRNGEFYLERFIHHYTQMGFRHLIFMDNGSTDKTIAIAKKYKNVSIYTSDLPIEAHQALFKKRLPQLCVQGGWCLDADIDEFMDFPSSDVVNLRQFLTYLNENKYTTVLTQLLDMFSDRPVSVSAPENDDPHEILSVSYPYYDLSEVSRTDYRTSDLSLTYGARNTVSNPATQLLWGGIRKTLSGNEYLLTKHSLFSMEHSPELFPHVHFVDNARLADVSCVMRHYKLTSSALAIAVQNMERFPGNGKLYADFIEYITKNPTYQVKRPEALKLDSVNELVQLNFLFTSENYRQYVKSLQPGCAEERQSASQVLR
jgi:glycosyltransferase involved in cell wall biosynthesis